jgi:chromosome segregation ATPase
MQYPEPQSQLDRLVADVQTKTLEQVQDEFTDEERARYKAHGLKLKLDRLVAERDKLAALNREHRQEANVAELEAEELRAEWDELRQENARLRTRVENVMETAAETGAAWVRGATEIHSLREQLQRTEAERDDLLKVVYRGLCRQLDLLAKLGYAEPAPGPTDGWILRWPEGTK